MATPIIIVFLVLLFLLGFITKRRYGVLGLALCAGALLSQYFAGSATGFIQGSGFILLSPPLSTVVSIGLVLLPPVFLLFGGPKYHSRYAAGVSGVAFALFGTLLILPALTSSMILDLPARQAYDLVQRYDTVLVAVGIAGAIGDMMLAHGPKFGRKH